MQINSNFKEYEIFLWKKKLSTVLGFEPRSFDVDQSKAFFFHRKISNSLKLYNLHDITRE